MVEALAMDLSHHLLADRPERAVRLLELGKVNEGLRRVGLEEISPDGEGME